MVVISDKYKIVFIHIPKNAGTFITYCLKQIDEDIRYIYSNSFGHQTYSFLQNLDLFENIKDYTFFCVLRNPYDNILSFYNFTRSNALYKDLTFTEQINKYGFLYQMAYIKDLSNNIVKNIHIINFKNLINEFKNFLINNNVEISKIDFSKMNKINKTIYIKNELSNEELNFLNDRFPEEINGVLSLLSE